MSRRLTTLLACLACLATFGLAATARADIDVFINFDVDPNGMPLESPAVINDAYAAWGVTFGSTSLGHTDSEDSFRLGVLIDSRRWSLVGRRPGPGRT